MIGRLLTREVEITSRAANSNRDIYGNETDASPETTTVPGELQQQQATEDGEVSDTRWVLFLPAGTPLDIDDTVTVDGQAFELDGEPWPVWNPRLAAVSHVEARLQRVSGSST